ncbi:hypothetical protein AKJ47_02480 [candidate division MSBL1 archaeon SCGC-AAA261G05]|uniref:4-vinyl reductase 4VR domain-containing protein n=2 Tax=candidate division MSBL1 TaxID=215777 RepID=A0A133UY42_9EURY|nr:hypothetical protein AKJ42_03740 [candidate division MSBL1 archaeon SCGC-AAA261C02]KXB03306.1 hypothetical protein AKJ47_02480 [candidate division MSBL1 archaeon SCGC-AAA261G05]
MVAFEEVLEEGEGIIMRNVTFADLRKRLEDQYTRSVAATILFEVGQYCGERSASRLAEEEGVEGRELLSAIKNHKEGEGWAELDFETVDLDRGRGRIVAADCFEAKGYEESTEPICHFLRGYLSGALSHVTGSELVLEEEQCIAAGDRTCQFVLKKME